MKFSEEITARIDKLPPHVQRDVLRYVAFLDGALPKGEPRLVLRPFAGTLDAGSACELSDAIEEDCERADGSGW